MRIAVIGASADDLGVLQGNYHGTAVAPVTPLEGLRKHFAVTYAQGSALADGAPVVLPETALRDLTAEYFVDGKSIATRPERRIDHDFNRAAPLPQMDAETPFAVRWMGRFVPPGPGEYALAIDVPACWKYCKRHDAVRLWIDGKPLAAGEVAKGRVAVTYRSDGRAVPIRLELDHVSEDEGIRLLWTPPADPLIAQAVAATRDADVAVVLAGLSPDLEGEALQVQVPGFVGGDRTDIALPQAQIRLLKAVRATGKPVVLVLASGSAVAVNPDLADAVLTMWYPGEAGGTALAETLLGLTNPSGRLPVTFYRSTTDLPAFVDYGMKERTYRYFTGTPLWGFGHGLSYTRFAYGAARVRGGTVGSPVTVSATVHNVGRSIGDEVVQVYVVPPTTGERPNLTDPVLQRQLAGFTRATLKPGARAAVALTLDPRSISVVLRDGTRRVLPGRYRIWIGGGQPDASPGVWTDITLTGAAQDLPK